MRTPLQLIRDFYGKTIDGRSPQWPKVRAAHIATNPNCESCGTTANLNVHHIIPFHIAPDMELQPENLITLCENGTQKCHWQRGHLALSWKKWNPHCIADADRFWEARSHAKTNQP